MLNQKQRVFFTCHDTQVVSALAAHYWDSWSDSWSDYISMKNTKQVTSYLNVKLTCIQYNLKVLDTIFYFNV